MTLNHSDKLGALALARLGLPALPADARNYMTPQGYAAMRAELFALIDDERPQVVEVVHWAASNGDRSENGDYLYGKKRLREIDRRIRFLTKRLEIAEVVDSEYNVVAKVRKSALTQIRK